MRECWRDGPRAYEDDYGVRRQVDANGERGGAADDLEGASEERCLDQATVLELRWKNERSVSDLAGKQIGHTESPA